MAQSQGVLVLGCPAANIQDVTGRKREDFPHLLRSPFFYTETSDLILHFLHVNSNYSDIAVVVDPSNAFYNGMGNRMRSFLRSNPQPYVREIRPNFYFLRSDTTDGTAEEKVRQTLHDVNKTARGNGKMLLVSQRTGFETFFWKKHFSHAKTINEKSQTFFSPIQSPYGQKIRKLKPFEN